MTALEYMKSQIENCKRNLDIASNRTGVTTQELNNIRTKIGYYEAAARALEREE